MFVDNTVAISIAKSEQVNAKNEQVDVKFHHVKSLISNRNVKLSHVSIVDQVADVLTKPVNSKTLARHVGTLGLSDA